MTTLEVLAPYFEQLLAVPAAERERVLGEMTLDEASRKRLRRMLEADAEAADGLERLISGSAAAAAATPKAQRLGPYRLLRELGAGGMGTVFLAERADGQFDRQVAIKLLRGFPTHEAVRRLRQERQILAGLDHPNIARLLDGGETEEGQPWLAIEYVDGAPLLEYVRRNNPDRAERLALFEAMLEAVAAAHRHLIVHRDIKPANVLVTQAGVVKLLDFGIARLVEEGEEGHAPDSSTRIFSRGYASPEQEQGRTITTATDIYSLGILLREMLTGRRDPRDPAIAPITPVPLDPELGGIIGKATAAEPAQRYADVAEFADDLRRHRDGRPVRAARWTRTYRLRKFIGRHRIGFALTMLSFVVLAGFVWRLDRERARALEAEAAAVSARSAAERDAARARASLDFMRNAFAAAAPDRALSREVSVRSLLDAARAQLVEEGDPVVLQAMQRLLSYLYADLGEQATAMELMRTGLASATPDDAAEGLRLAADQDQFANLLAASGNLEDALRATREARALRQRFAPNDPIEHLREIDSEAFVEHRRGNNPEAIRMLQDAMQVMKRTENVPSDLYLDIAQLLSGLLAVNGDVRQALEITDQVLERLRAEHPAGSLDQVTFLRSRANALRVAGDAAGSERSLREAIGLQERIVGPGGARMMLLNNDLALALNDLGRYREAAELLQESNRAGIEAGADSPIDAAISHANTAGVLESAGDYATAMTEFDAGLAILDEAGIDADDRTRRSLERARARTLALAGQPKQSLEILGDLRRRCARIEGEESDECAMVTWQMAIAARVMHRPDIGQPLLDEALRRFSALVPPTHPLFLHARRVSAAFAMDRADLASAARDADAAVAGFKQGGATLDLAIARAELAAIRLRQGRADDARKLLRKAMPPMREALLPGEINRAAAERLALQLGIDTGT